MKTTYTFYGLFFLSASCLLFHFRQPVESSRLSLPKDHAGINSGIELPLVKGADKNWLERIQKNIVDQEYDIVPMKDGSTFTGLNRKNKLRSTYQPSELTLTNDGDPTPWRISFKLVDITADEMHYQPMETAHATVKNNLVEFNHSKFLVQFQNSGEGVRQNVIVPKALTNATRKLRVNLQLNKEVKVKKIDATSLEIIDATDATYKKLVAYNGLKAWDKTGKPLTASLECNNNLISWIVDVTDATYPVTIDPVSTTADWESEANVASTNYGWAVSTAGDVNNDGYSDVIVGAYTFSNGQASEGRAFLYHGSATGLSATANWTAESNQAGANFGFSVADAGDVNGDGYDDVIIGAQNWTNGQANEGRAYVYHGSSTGLGATAAWTMECNQVSALFGISVASAGDVNTDGYDDVIIGATYYDNGQVDEGNAFVYHGSATGVRTTFAAILQGNVSNARYGCSVSTAGDVNNDGYSDVIVGAKLLTNGEASEGKVFVYHGSSAGVSTVAAWTAEANQAVTDFGTCVSTAGDVNNDGYSDVIIGASYFDSGETDEGKAFVYHGSATGLNAAPAWTAESNQVNGKLGNGVYTAGDVNGDGYSDVIVGATWFDNGQTDEGQAYIFEGSPIGLNTVAATTVESNSVSSGFGRFVAAAGDVNNDGYSDVLVGAHLLTNGQAQEGKVFLYYGYTHFLLPVSFTGFSATPAAEKVLLEWSVAENTKGSEFIVQRSSTGNDFDSIGTVIADRNATSKFLFTDMQPENGKSFYRIAEMTAGKKVVLSTTRIVLRNAALQVHLTSNPVRETGVLNIISKKNVQAEIGIYSTSGVLLYKHTARIIPGNQAIHLPAGNLRPGTYIVHVSTPTGFSQVKMIRN